MDRQKKIPMKTRLLISLLKLMRFPELPSKPQKGKFYRIPLPGYKSANGDITHGSIRIGTENKVIVMFHGGGVSWDEYMAARPTSTYEESEGQRFYASDSEFVGDIVTGHGVAGGKKENPFHSWSVIASFIIQAISMWGRMIFHTGILMGKMLFCITMDTKIIVL